MATFLLIRHAAHDLLGRAIAGRSPGVHLNADGQTQAERLAERLGRLPIQAVYSSPLERARETAQPLARRLGIETSISEALSEIDFGNWSGRTLQELRELPRWQAFNAYRSGTRIPNGELMLEVQARMVAEIERLRAKQPDAFLALVGHGDPIKAAVAYYLGIPLDLFQRIEISPASISVLELHDYGARVLRVNDTGELTLA